MRHILITGMNSYIGNAVAEYLKVWNEEHHSEDYRVKKLSLRDDAWKNEDFSAYDSILHVAGMAHADIGHVSDETKDMYYRVNTQLTAEVAEKAKKDGVHQFVYFSSVIVYGDSAKVGKSKLITAQTSPVPANFYGDSKLQAEKKLEMLTDEERTEKRQRMRTEYENTGEKQDKVSATSFQLAILRLPMVYGRDSKGNYPLLEKIAAKLPVFPDIRNERSMIYVENLCEFVKILIDRGEGGLFFPQNGEHTTTSEMVRLIAEARGKEVRLIKCLNPFVRFSSKIPGKIGNLCNKAFGSLTVDESMSVPEGYDYRRYTLDESIRRIEGKKE